MELRWGRVGHLASVIFPIFEHVHDITAGIYFASICCNRTIDPSQLSVRLKRGRWFIRPYSRGLRSTSRPERCKRITKTRHRPTRLRFHHITPRMQRLERATGKAGLSRLEPPSLPCPSRDLSTRTARPSWWFGVGQGRTASSDNFGSGGRGAC
jgi:hypothetical protein